MIDRVKRLYKRYYYCFFVYSPLKRIRENIPQNDCSSIFAKRSNKSKLVGSVVVIYTNKKKKPTVPCNEPGKRTDGNNDNN